MSTRVRKCEGLHRDIAADSIERRIATVCALSEIGGVANHLFGAKIMQTVGG